LQKLTYIAVLMAAVEHVSLIWWHVIKTCFNVFWTCRV